MSADLDLDKDIERRLEVFETVRRQRASLMQMFSNAGQEESEKVRDEAVKLFGPATKVPCEWRRFFFLLASALDVREAFESPGLEC